MLKQPVTTKLYTNVAIVKLKIGKGKFEIACYKNKVQQFRQKV
jgi:ribosome maturation protein Sdo1